MAERRPQTFIVRILGRQRDDWKGQVVEVRSGQIYPFRSVLHLQRRLLALAEEPANGVAAYLERRIRHELARTQDVLIVGGQRKTAAPTVQAILDLFRSLQNRRDRHRTRGPAGPTREHESRDLHP